MRDRVLRKLRPALVAATGVVAMALLSAAPAAAAPAPAADVAAPTAGYAGYAGDAYATGASVGATVTSGFSAFIAFGCGTQPGFHTQNTVASTAAGPLLSTGTGTTTGDAGVNPTRTVTSATTQNVNVLSGLVTATAIQARSTVTQTGNTYVTSAAGTSFTNLKVAGRAMAVTPAPNTVIPLPGLGRVVLNEQIPAVSAASGTLTVNALHVIIDQKSNPLGIATGTNVIVSHARSLLSPPKYASLVGFAYGTQATVAGAVRSGPSFPAYMPCEGTNGKTITNTGAGTTVPAVLSTGTITDTARGTLTATTALGQTTSTVQSANLLGGLVTASGIKAVATVNKTGTTTALSDNGSSIGSITLRGVVLNANAAPNTVIPVPGVGTLFLHRVLRTGNQIEVRMIELDVTTAVGSVPAGATVYAGVAHVGAL